MPQLLDLVAELRRVLEAQVLGGGEHLLLELDHQPLQLLGRARAPRRGSRAACSSAAAPGGRAADLPRDVHAGRRDRRGQALPRRRRVQQPEADPRRHPDPDRRQRRAQDAALRRQVRRRLATCSATSSASSTCSACSRATARTSAATRPRSPRRAWRRSTSRPTHEAARRSSSRRRRRGDPGPRAGAGLRRRPGRDRRQAQAYLDAGLDGITIVDARRARHRERQARRRERSGR